MMNTKTLTMKQILIIMVAVLTYTKAKNAYLVERWG